LPDIIELIYCSSRVQLSVCRVSNGRSRVVSIEYDYPVAIVETRLSSIALHRSWRESGASSWLCRQNTWVGLTNCRFTLGKSLELRNI